MVGSPWYLYRQSSFGAATGFFANSNHMATLLLVSIAFLAALGAAIRENSADARLRSAALALVAGGILVIVIGIALNGSLAGYALGIPVGIASLLMLFPSRRRFIPVVAGVAALVGMASIAVLMMTPLNRPFNSGIEASFETRHAIFDHSRALVGEFGPIGSGLGSFQKVYLLTEDPAKVDTVYVNHAHNDYVELAVELGLAGALLVAAFLIWWVFSAWRTLRLPAADQFAVAGMIASAVIILHSAVDFPLRTTAISAVFAMSIGLMLKSRRTARSETDLRPTRHLSMG
jgi:O-antigen ligase